jgi:sterol desaturase/sphingolipid hydroxylase (fatty acid hydroxylase superfamily)
MLEIFDVRALLLIALVFVPLEHLVPLHEGRKLLRKGWLTDLMHYVFSGLLIRLGLMGVLLVAARAADAAVPSGLRAGVEGLPLWVQVPLVLLIADFGFYAAHRMFHAVPWLWPFHAVHHSIEELDWLAAHRVHPVDQIVTKAFSLVPVFALGFSEVAIGIFAVLYHWQALLIHSNVRIGFGPLRWLFASPDFHHWHHANEREAYDKNFAGQLPLWDILFGTAHMPAGRLPTAYGVDEPVPSTFHGQIAYPFVRLAGRIRRRRAAAAARPAAEPPAPAPGG